MLGPGSRTPGQKLDKTMNDMYASGPMIQSPGYVSPQQQIAHERFAW